MSPATIIVGIVILIAVIYMVRHVRGMFNGSSGCSCCDGGALPVFRVYHSPAKGGAVFPALQTRKQT